MNKLIIVAILVFSQASMAKKQKTLNDVIDIADISISELYKPMPIGVPITESPNKRVVFSNPKTKDQLRHYLAAGKTNDVECKKQLVKHLLSKTKKSPISDEMFKNLTKLKKRGNSLHLILSFEAGERFKDADAITLSPNVSARIFVVNHKALDKNPKWGEGNYFPPGVDYSGNHGFPIEVFHFNDREDYREMLTMGTSSNQDSKTFEKALQEVGSRQLPYSCKSLAIYKGYKFKQFEEPLYMMNSVVKSPIDALAHDLFKDWHPPVDAPANIAK